MRKCKTLVFTFLISTLVAQSSSGVAAAPLENTYWEFTVLGAIPIQGPYFVLNSASKRFVAADGCNWIKGTYSVQGDQLSFTPHVTTLRACPGVKMQRVVSSLLREVRWKISGQTLELSDQTGQFLARLRVRNPQPK